MNVFLLILLKIPFYESANADLPIIITPSVAYICPNQKVTFSATGCTGILTWTGGNTGTSIAVNPAITTSFTAVCSTGGQATATVNVAQASTNLSTNIISGMQIHQLNQSITASNKIGTNAVQTAKVIYQAGASITLLPGFEVKENSVFNAQIIGCNLSFIMPEESAEHEGTWLQWPHHYQYGTTYRNRLDATWVKMTKELVSSEKVHIIAYNATEKTRIIALLNAASVSMTNIDFKIYPTDDVWVRDNGPIYVKGKTGNTVIEDWGFNGWGNKTQFANCNTIPSKIATDQGFEVKNLNAILTIEGGAIEIDGNGTFLATKSSILNSNRNPNITQVQAEAIFTNYLGVTNFIWLDGVAGLEITDMHIDGFARFGNSTTIVSMVANDLIYWEVPPTDITKLYAAKNKNGVAYNFVTLPLTQNNVITAYGKNLGYKGSYVNYYIANTKVLVPHYNDPNDLVANGILQTLYPNKTIVGIDVRNLYENGGMVHCVTQQQPK